MPRTNYIFVDFENVQEIDLDRIANKPAHVTLVMGSRQKHLPLDLVRKLLKYADQVAVRETHHGGKNALDLIIAQHIGETKKADENGYFHIVSKDNDFNSLIANLKNGGTLAARRATFNAIPVLMNTSERVKFLTELFKANPSNRPKKLKGLESQIQANFGKALSAQELKETVSGLVAARVLKLSKDDGVTYI